MAGFDLAGGPGDVGVERGGEVAAGVPLLADTVAPPARLQLDVNLLPANVNGAG